MGMTRGPGEAAQRDKDEVDHLDNALESDKADHAQGVADGTMDEGTDEGDLARPEPEGPIVDLVDL
jgi:hypothetical protein